MRCTVLLAVLFIFPVSLLAQDSTPAPILVSALSPSREIGVFVFGKNGQSPDQQLKDESECYATAKQQSGIDPKAPAPVSVPTEQKLSVRKAPGKSADAADGTTGTGTRQHQEVPRERRRLLRRSQLNKNRKQNAPSLPMQRASTPFSGPFPHAWTRAITQ
jgi:hypothetical protein